MKKQYLCILLLTLSCAHYSKSTASDYPKALVLKDAPRELLFRAVAYRRLGPIVFAMLKQPKGFRPLVLIKGEKGIRYVGLEKDFDSYGWAFASGDPVHGRYFGFIEIQMEGRGPELILVSSLDGAKSWQLSSSLPKPNFSAELKDLKVSNEGLAVATIEHDNKIYTARSGDFGKNWSYDKGYFLDTLSQDEPLLLSSRCDAWLTTGNTKKNPCPLPKEFR
jgi:hypothetical protein